MEEEDNNQDNSEDPVRGHLPEDREAGKDYHRY